MRQVANIFYISILFLLSCSDSTKLNKEDYIAFIETKSNGLKKQVRVNDWEYTFLFKPVEYVALMELQGHGDTARYKQRVVELSGTVWFNIYIKPVEGKVNPLKKDVNGLKEYNQRLNYFLMNAASNLNLYYGDKGSMNTIGYHFENNYGLTPMDVMVVGFKIPDTRPGEDVVLEYSDELFNNGPIKIKISKERFSDIPELIL